MVGGHQLGSTGQIEILFITLIYLFLILGLLGSLMRKMWELGNMVYLVVATTYKMPKFKVGEGLKMIGIHNVYLLFYQIQLYKMDVTAEETTWEDACKIDVGS